MLRTGTSAWNSRILPFRTDKAQGQEADRAPHSMGRKSQQPPWWYQVSLACPSNVLPKPLAATCMEGCYVAWPAPWKPVEAARVLRMQLQLQHMSP